MVESSNMRTRLDSTWTIRSWCSRSSFNRDGRQSNGGYGCRLTFGQHRLLLQTSRHTRVTATRGNLIEACRYMPKEQRFNIEHLCIVTLFTLFSLLLIQCTSNVIHFVRHSDTNLGDITGGQPSDFPEPFLPEVPSLQTQPCFPLVERSRAHDAALFIGGMLAGFSEYSLSSLSNPFLCHCDIAFQHLLALDLFF